MPKKSLMYAMYEAINAEMARDDKVIFQYEYQTPVSSFGELPIINLEANYGFPRVAHSGIVENWYGAVAVGAARVGLKTVADIPTMAFPIVFHWLSTNCKMTYNTGGKETLPFVIIVEQPGQDAGAGIAHSDYEADSWLMHIPGLKTVVPSTAHDAKGLMTAAIRSPHPIAFILSMGLRAVIDEVPDEPYEVSIGEAAIRTEGSDITIVSSSHGMIPALKAAKRLQDDGVGVEVIDLRTLNPMDTKAIVESVRKTKRLLTVDMTYYTLGPGAEVVARAAEAVPEAKFRRIAHPDAPGPGAPEMRLWLKPNDENIYKAAKKLLG